MTTVEITRPPHARFKVPFFVFAILAAVTSATAGYLNGTVDGDIPWPATVSEATFYSAAAWVTVIAGVLAVFAAIFASLSGRRRPAILRFVLWVFASLAIALALFLLGFAIGAL